MPTLPASTITSAIDAPCDAAIGSSLASTSASCAGLLAAQSFCGARRMRAPLAPPRISEPRNVEADAHAVSIISPIDRPDALIASLTAASS